MTNNYILTPIAGLIGLAIAGAILRSVIKKDGGEGKVAEIAEKIHKGAMTFMKREFMLISLFAVVIATLIFVFQDFSFYNFVMHLIMQINYVALIQHLHFCLVLFRQ